MKAMWGSLPRFLFIAFPGLMAENTSFTSVLSGYIHCAFRRTDTLYLYQFQIFYKAFHV